MNCGGLEMSSSSVVRLVLRENIRHVSFVLGRVRRRLLKPFFSWSPCSVHTETVYRYVARGLLWLHPRDGV